MATKMTQEELAQENMAQTISKTEEFFNTYKKSIWGAVIAVVVVALGTLAYSKFVYGPATAEAQEATYPAEMYFQQGAFDLALNGDGQALGFAEIINEYGAKAGKAVYLYAGACAAQIGEWEDALVYLNKYNGKDVILGARALALKGDCYMALEQFSKAVSAYGRAAAKGNNMFAATYLVKQGQAYEALGNEDKAKACYQNVKDNYPQSLEAYDIDKYLAK